MYDSDNASKDDLAFERIKRGLSVVFASRIPENNYCKAYEITSGEMILKTGKNADMLRAMRTQTPEFRKRIHRAKDTCLFVKSRPLQPGDKTGFSFLNQDGIMVKEEYL